MRVIIKYNNRVTTAIFGAQEINFKNDSVVEIKDDHFTWQIPLNQGFEIHITKR